ncbi:hypothetical protein R1sor_024088 [Riccia sorocarpa]|uniref:Uncharacterized protein n=1 Tax=Riccia sorocarpa TaxID=122646 RepID=A0ABD3GRP5_9MARC
MGAGSSAPAREPEQQQRVRRSKSWAVEDTSKIVGRPLSSSFRLRLQCAVHEIGTQRGCRRENYLQQRGYGALVGLHSNWIGHFILASARPSDRLLEEHHLLYQLHSQHIAAVINLQVPGEHGSCGDGVKLESGFSYTPQRLMERQIFYFNFPMEDSKHFELDYMLDICHTVDSQIATGEKVIYHRWPIDNKRAFEIDLSIV